MTGVNFFAGEVLAKRLELFREVVPTASRIAVFVNPANFARAETQVNELQAASRERRKMSLLALTERTSKADP